MLLWHKVMIVVLGRHLVDPFWEHMSMDPALEIHQPAIIMRTDGKQAVTVASNVGRIERRCDMIFAFHEHLSER